MSEKCSYEDAIMIPEKCLYVHICSYMRMLKWYQRTRSALFLGNNKSHYSRNPKLYWRYKRIHIPQVETDFIPYSQKRPFTRNIALSWDEPRHLNRFLEISTFTRLKIKVHSSFCSQEWIQVVIGHLVQYKKPDQ